MDRQKLSKTNQAIRHLDASPSLSKSIFEGYNPDIPRLLLDLCQPDTSLFPRLFSLKSECRNDAEVLGVLPLLNPSLRSLDLVIHHSATDYMHELLEGVENNLKNLEHLSISYRPAPETVSSEPTDDDNLTLRESDSYFYFPMIAPTLPRSLRTLCVPAACASIDTLFHVSHLPLLETLTFIGKWEGDVHEEEWLELEASSFPALNRLVVSDCSIRAATGLLSVIPESAPLCEVDITLSGTSSGLQELCTTFARFHRSIHGITINHTSPDSNLTRVQEISEALAACSKLERLTLNTPIEISDMEFGEFVDQLPCACTVYLGEHRTQT